MSVGITSHFWVSYSEVAFHFGLHYAGIVHNLCPFALSDGHAWIQLTMWDYIARAPPPLVFS